jgi:hypothetical protein
MLSVIFKHLMLSVVMQNVIMQNVVMQNVVLLNVVMQNVVMQNVVMQNVVLLNIVLLNVVAPLFILLFQFFRLDDFVATNTTCRHFKMPKMISNALIMLTPRKSPNVPPIKIFYSI